MSLSSWQPAQATANSDQSKEMAESGKMMSSD